MAGLISRMSLVQVQPPQPETKNQEIEVPGEITYLTASAAPETLDRKARTIEFVITTARADRQGDIVEPKGLNIKEYLENPQFLWAHDMTQPPIGKTLSVTVGDDSIRIKVEFTKITDMGNEVFELYANGFLRCCSIGFQLEEFQWIQAEEDALAKQPGSLAASNSTTPGAEKPAETVKIVRRGLHILKALLVEVSAVPVPANPDAMCRGLSLVKTKSLREQVCKAAGIADPATRTRGVAVLEGDLSVPREFVKSLVDRGSSKKNPIPATIEVGDPLCAASVEIEWEAVKEIDGEVVEAKVLGVNIVVPRPEKKALAQEPPPVGTPTGPSRQDPPSVAAVATVSVEQIDAEIAAAQTKALAFAKSLLEIQGALA